MKRVRIFGMLGILLFWMAQTCAASETATALSQCFGSVQRFEYDQKICNIALEREKALAALELRSATQRVDAEIKLNEQLTRSNQLANDLIAQQLWSGQLVFLVVAVVVLSGLALSYLQFKNSTVSGLSETAQLETTSLELSHSGLQIKSQFIGLVILLTSLAFFYLYLINVYRITTIGDKSVGGTVASAVDKAASAVGK